MIHGIGTDIVAIARIKKLFESSAESFVSRILNTEEEAIFNQLADAHKINHLAKRFAAKEACAKALGTGIGEALSFHDITITNTPQGKPEMTVAGKEGLSFQLSLSDEKDYALAFVIATKV